jgi:hypothetical protein
MGGRIIKVYPREKEWEYVEWIGVQSCGKADSIHSGSTKDEKFLVEQVLGSEG